MNLAAKIERFEKVTKDIHEAESLLASYQKEQQTLREEILLEAPALKELFSKPGNRSAMHKEHLRHQQPRAIAARKAKYNEWAKEAARLVANHVGLDGMKGVRVTVDQIARAIGKIPNAARGRLDTAVKYGYLLREEVHHGRIKCAYTVRDRLALVA